MASTIQNDRSFVGRGDSVGVFKTVDDELQYVATLKNLRLKDGKAFSPAKVKLGPGLLPMYTVVYRVLKTRASFAHRPCQFSLANGETSLVTLQSGDEHNLHRVDIERGIVVETWVRARAATLCWMDADNC